MGIIKFNEIKVSEIDSLEETNTPAIGVVCGGGCVGAWCF